MTEDVLESGERRVPDSPDQLELDLTLPSIEVRRARYVGGYQYHVDFRDASGEVTATAPAPAWSHRLYRMYLAALDRAERAEENERMASKEG